MRSRARTRVYGECTESVSEVRLVWDGSGTGVGRVWDGCGTGVGRVRDGCGTGVGRVCDGSGSHLLNDAGTMEAMGTREHVDRRGQKNVLTFGALLSNLNR